MRLTLIVIAAISIAQSSSGAQSARAGNVALAALRAPVQTNQSLSIKKDSTAAKEKLCRRHWSCVVIGATVGAFAGGLIGNALVPKAEYREFYSCGFDGCGPSKLCDKHCDEPVTRVWMFGAAGGILGGLAGHYVWKGAF